MADDRENYVHLDKRINLSDLITVTILIVGGVITITTLQNNLETISTRMERTIEDQIRRDSSQDTAVQRFRSEIRADVRDIQQSINQVQTLLIEQNRVTVNPNYRDQ